MKDLIKALQILEIYLEGFYVSYPTGCEHDVLYVYVHPGKVSEGDKEVLEELGFLADYEEEYFYSYRYGSA